MNFMEWLAGKGYSDARIGEILCYFRKLPEDTVFPLKVASEFLLQETDQVSSRKEKRIARKIEAGHLYQKQKKKNPQMKKSVIVRQIAASFRVKEDCIYAYLREIGL